MVLMEKIIHKTQAVGLLVLFVIFGIMMGNGDTYATASTLSLSISNSTVSTSVAPTSGNGTFSKSSDTTISASTNNATGYTLSISAPSNAGSDYDKLINSGDNTAKLSSISSATTEAQFKALNGTAYNGKWGYLPSKYCSNGTSSTCAANSDFLPAPTTAGDVMDQTSLANSTANIYTIAIGTRIDSSVKTGSYSNSYIVKLVANAIPYSITYNDGVVSNMPSDVSSTTPDSTVNISSDVPVRASYSFLGWCAGTVTNNDGTDSCSGTVYNPNGGGTNLTYTLDQTGGSNVLSLVAMWKKMTYMQDVATWGSTLSAGDEIIATDARDGKEYTVAKLADGNIWMTQNLDHDIGDIAGGTYTSADTDISANWTPSTATYATGTTTWNNTTSAPESYDPGDLCWNGTLDSSWSTTLSNGTTACGNDKHYHIGNYYNWTAAVAMNDSSSYTTQNTDVNQSICPAGWRLPIGGTTNTGSKSFQYLVNQLSLTSGTSGNIQSSPVYFVVGGYWYGSSPYVGSSGYYWSSVAYSSGYAYYLVFDVDGHLDPQAYYDRNRGYLVRCVAR